MRVKVGSVGYLEGNERLPIGLSEDQHRVEFLGDWLALADVKPTGLAERYGPA